MTSRERRKSKQNGEKRRMRGTFGEDQLLAPWVVKEGWERGWEWGNWQILSCQRQREKDAVDLSRWQADDGMASHRTSCSFSSQRWIIRGRFLLCLGFWMNIKPLFVLTQCETQRADQGLEEGWSPHGLWIIMQSSMLLVWVHDFQSDFLPKVTGTTYHFRIYRYMFFKFWQA